MENAEKLPVRPDLALLARQIRGWGEQLGFQKVGISDIDLSRAEPRLSEWLRAGFHGEMDYMAKHGVKRARPAELVPGTLRVIAARIDYSPPRAADSWQVINDAGKAFDTHAVVIFFVGGCRSGAAVLAALLPPLGEVALADNGPHV